MGKNQHIVPHDGRWAVRGENNSRVSSIHNTQSAAINAGRSTAQREHSELVIHGRDGRIREKDTHGHDPYPPKG
jgi:hypothetical protein